MTKNFLLNSLTVLLGVLTSIVLCEAAAQLAYKVKFGAPYSKDHIKEMYKELKRKINISNDHQFGYEEYTGTVAPHPYFGYTYSPQANNLVDGSTRVRFSPEDCTVNSQGLISVGEDPFLNDKNNRLDILVLGGSVASQLVCHAGTEIAKGLSQNEKYKNKKINILGAAVGAWREPQQLGAFAYALALGYRPDIVLAINGFNEAANPYASIYKNTYTLYPIQWASMQYGNNPGTIENITNIGRYRSFQEKLFQTTEGLEKSALAGLVTRTVNDFLAAKILREIDAIGNESYNFAENGPKNLPNTDPGKVSVGVWINSIIIETALASKFDSKFIEVLQPTVLTGNKRLTEDEVKLKDVWDHSKVGVPRHYSKMKNLAQNFSSTNYIFADATGVFDEVPHNIYVDPCHLTPEGYALLGEFITNVILTRTH